MDLTPILNCFFDDVSEIKVSPIISGHINTTFLVRNGSEQFVLQKVNADVFPHLEVLEENHRTINSILEDSDYPFKIVNFQPTLKGNYFDEYEKVWRLLGFVSQAKTYLKAPNATLIRKATQAFGTFYKTINAHSDRYKIQNSLPGFIDFEHRAHQFCEALQRASTARLKQASPQITYAKNCLPLLEHWNTMMKTEHLPSRIIHADPKISNILFDEKDEVLAIIDLDTLMPSTILYDFGDMVRSYTNLANEDDAEAEQCFSPEFYHAVKEGFLEGIGEELKPIEKESLDYAGRCVIFVQGLRFLTDFLNGDCYYHTDYETHNLDRTQNQFQLLQELEEFLLNK